MSSAGKLRPGLAGNSARNRLAEMAGRQSSPYTGKLSARPAGKPGDFFLVIGEFATIPSTPPDSATINVLQSAPQSVFLRHGGIYRSDVAKENQPRVGTNCLPLVGPKTQGKERAGRNTLFSSSAMSSGRLFLDQVGRHQSPSPLRRHAQTTTHFPRGNSKPELSTLLGSGTFYFALTIRARLERGRTRTRVGKKGLSPCQAESLAPPPTSSC